MTAAAIDGFASPTQVGPFRIVGTLGAGGMGTVYLGERSELFEQRVAIKFFHSCEMDGDVASVAGGEEYLLQSLDHSNIVRLLDTGVSSNGQRYLVMEYIEGLPIDRYCDQRGLSVGSRIGLLFQVMDAVEHAHRHLVLHSDLKPANILVTSEGRVKLLDFGVATPLSERNAAEGTMRGGGFTSSFASPEQRAGERLTVASDVYALGVLASLLLGGTVPEEAAVDGSRQGSRDSDGESPVRRLRRCDGETVRGIAENRATSPDGLMAMLRGDLEFILQKALRVDPAARFLHVEEFANDLRLHLEGRPIVARRTGRVERMHKWMQRHRLAGALGMVLVGAVGVSTLGVVGQTARAARQRRVAETRLHDLVRLTGTLEGELYDSVAPLAHSEAAKDSLLQGATETLDRLAADDSRDTVLSLEVAQQYGRLARLRMAQQGSNPARRGESLKDVGKGAALLEKVLPRDAGFAAAQRQRAELTDLGRQISSL